MPTKGSVQPDGPPCTRESPLLFLFLWFNWFLRWSVSHHHADFLLEPFDLPPFCCCSAAFSAFLNSFMTLFLRCSLYARMSPSHLVTVSFSQIQISSATWNEEADDALWSSSAWSPGLKDRSYSASLSRRECINFVEFQAASPVAKQDPYLQQV